MTVTGENLLALVKQGEKHWYSRYPPLFPTLVECARQVLGDNAAEADKLFAGEPETALIAAILWAFEVSHGRYVLLFAGVVPYLA